MFSYCAGLVQFHLNMYLSVCAQRQDDSKEQVASLGSDVMLSSAPPPLHAELDCAKQQAVFHLGRSLTVHLWAL